MIPRRLWLAIFIACLGHGLFILTARYRLSYDAYTHMLFANHYAENWFSLWEPRWYAGFTVVSYPPLTHQLIALFIPLLGFEKAFALILWMVTTLYPLGIYAFSRIFTGRTSASYAALASAILLPVYVTAHIFGQLPFLASTLMALFSAASLDRFLRDGGAHNLLLTVSLYTTTMALHHATLMVHPFLILAVVVHRVYRGDAETQSLDKKIFVFSAALWQRLFLRLVIFVVCALLASLFVIFPFWEWGMDQSMQTPIDHLSRHNFLASPLALAIFFFPMYGLLMAIIPFLVRNWHPRFLGLRAAFLVLFLLGLGGTTPLPRLLFGASWEWLTYDRFAFWSCLTLTPFFGILFIRMKGNLRFKTQPKTFDQTQGKPFPLRTKLIPTLTFSLFAATSLGAWFTPFFLQLQPDPIDMQPIVDFLDEDDRSQYRYLTFGFGDQFAYLNLLTDAATIDGSYHTARAIPELRESGIGQIDTVYWALKGIPAIEPILRKSGGYGVRWGFVNPHVVKPDDLGWGVVYRSPFVPLLEELGWKKIKTLENQIVVYENPNAIIPAPSIPPQTPPVTSFAWGVFPMLSLVTTLSLSALRIAPLQAEIALRRIHAVLVGLMPVSLCFWYFITIAEFPHDRVYFTYTHALFFLSDALVVLAILLWFSVKVTQLPLTNYQFPPLPSTFHFLFLLFLLSSFSVFWSREGRTSLYISLHFWLVFLLILSLREWLDSWKSALYGFCAALSIQLIAGFIGFGLQSTAFLDFLNINWPGTLESSVRGASVVQLPDGLRILRAYGTLPHPNLLGGFALFTLLGPAGLFLANKRPNCAALILFGLGIVLIGLTFSRAAWLGLLAFLFLLILKSEFLDRKRLFLLILTFALTAFLTLYPLRDLVFTRISNAPVATEQLSAFGRGWLTEQAVDMIRQHPLTGVGIGSFVIELSTYAIEGALIEPVHNILLLVGAELGILGPLLLAGMFPAIVVNIVKAKSPQAILVSGTLAGLGIISLFDHYLWSLAPGRIMLALALGLWAGQVAHNEA
jgi:O-antigen ligase